MPCLGFDVPHLLAVRKHLAQGVHTPWPILGARIHHGGACFAPRSKRRMPFNRSSSCGICSRFGVAAASLFSFRACARWNSTSACGACSLLGIRGAFTSVGFAWCKKSSRNGACFYNSTDAEGIPPSYGRGRRTGMRIASVTLNASVNLTNIYGVNFTICVRV